MAPVVGTGAAGLTDIISPMGERGVLVCASHISSFDFCLVGPGGILLYHPDDSSLFFGLYEPRTMRKSFVLTQMWGVTLVHTSQMDRKT